MFGRLLCLFAIYVSVHVGIRRTGDLQLIHPKLQNKQQKAPDTTSHALNPPSGKSPGPPAGGLIPFACSFAFSRSNSAVSSAVSGMIFASVFERAGLGVRGEEVSLISEMLCFSSAIASDELLELAIVAGSVAPVLVRPKRA